MIDSKCSKKPGEYCRLHNPQGFLPKDKFFSSQESPAIMIPPSNEHVKYPRTVHLPESPGRTDDDKLATPETLKNLSSGIQLVVTEKFDGSNLTLTRNRFFGRSVDATNNAWDRPVKALWNSIRHEIPEGWRISGENMWARKSVAYENLPSVYMVFGMWDERNNLIPWEQTKEWAELLGLKTVTELYRGNDFSRARKIWFENHDDETSEGFVIRNSGSFSYKDFKLNVCKWVRANHIRTDDSWRHRTDFPKNSFASE